jgi:integrator complex subunit 1
VTHAFADVGHWPDVFVKIYVEDAVADRIFIDNPYCKPFVDNVITAFNTKLPPSSLFKSETWNSAARDTSSPLTIMSNDDESKTEPCIEHKVAVENWNVKVYPRFTHSQENVEKIVLEAIKEQLARRQQPETITKNFVRFLSIACGLVEIRIIAVSRIESWLHNHKLMKPAQELLAYLCYNCSASSQRDNQKNSQHTK